MAPLLNKNKTHKDLSYSTAFSHLLNYEHVLCKTKKENGLQIQRNGSQCKMFRLMFRCVIQRSLFLFLYRLYSTLIHDISFPGFRKKEAQWLRLTDFFNAVVTCFWRHSSVFCICLHYLHWFVLLFIYFLFCDFVEKFSSKFGSQRPASENSKSARHSSRRTFNIIHFNCDCFLSHLSWIYFDFFWLLRYFLRTSSSKLLIAQ